MTFKIVIKSDFVTFAGRPAETEPYGRELDQEIKLAGPSHFAPFAGYRKLIQRGDFLDFMQKSFQDLSFVAFFYSLVLSSFFAFFAMCLSL